MLVPVQLVMAREATRTAEALGGRTSTLTLVTLALAISLEVFLAVAWVVGHSRNHVAVMSKQM